MLRLKFVLLINVKMPTVGILILAGKMTGPEISIDLGYFSNYEQLKFHAQLS